MSRARNYKAEYARRVAYGSARGLSRAQARGHAPVLPATGSETTKPAFEATLERALRSLRRGHGTLSSLAADAHVSRERLSRYIKSHAGAHRERGQWRFHDERLRQVAIVEAGEGKPVRLKVIGFEPAHVAGKHAYEASLVLEDQSLAPDFVRRWEGQRIKDAQGGWHTLSTDLNELYRAMQMHSYRFEDFYNIPH